jgi:hypothetical protein
VRGVTGALALIVVLVSAAVGFWFFRLRTQPMPVVVQNATPAAITVFVNGVPAELITAESGCTAAGSATSVPSLGPGASGWFCRTSRGGRTGSRLCYEARTADGTVLAAVQWNGDDWDAHGSRLEVRPDDPRRECHVTVGG